MNRLTSRLGRLPLTWMAAVAAGAILVLGFLQFRGSEQVSRALQQRLGASLQSAAGRFAKGFDRELTRVVLFFDPPPPFEGIDLEDSYIERFRRWSETAPFPGLAQRVYLIRRVEAGVEVRALDRESNGFVPAACPAAFEKLCQRLSTRDEWQPGPPDMPPSFERGRGPLDAGNEAVVLRIVSFRRHEHRSGPPEGPPPVSGVVIVTLDPKVIRDEILPELAKQIFAGDELSSYRLTVLPVDEPGKTIYDSRPDVPGPVPSSGDAEADLFRGLPPPEVRSLEQELGLHFWKTREHPEPGPPPFSGHGPREHSPDFGMRFSGDDGPGPWRVVVTHPEGSLQTIAGKVRLQSLFVSLGTLALLGLSLAAILVSARRTQALATRQLEFVAGVTHELMTPLAAVRSAGQNLADGIVRDEERVRRYGAMIDAEGRRLAEMVGKVLDFAGMRSQQTKRPLERVSVRDWVERVVADSEHLRAEGDFELEVDVAEDAEVLGDPDALHTALGNLLTNAFKYAQEGHWASIRTSTETGRHGPHVQIRVADRGPGIRAEDVPYVFEPFYRGRRLAASNVPGSGLGLALVRNIIEAHGGKVRLETVEGGGSTFIVTLPAAAEEPT